WLLGAISSTRPEVRSEPEDSGPGRLTVAFPLVHSERDVTRVAKVVFALPGRLAAERKRAVVVALDEFQAVEGFNGGSVEHALRAAVQHQRRVGYVFAGSEPSLMEKMIGPKRPFYKAGPVMRLDKIPANVFSGFIEARFGANAGPAFAPKPVSVRRSSSWRATSPTTCNGSRMKRGTTSRAPAAAAPRSITCTARSPACCPSRKHCSKRCGNGSRWRSAARSVPSCCRMAATCCRRTLEQSTASAPRRAYSGRSRRWPIRIWWSRKARSTSSSTRCFVNGSHGGPSSADLSTELGPAARRSPGPRPARAARVGDVRLGQLRVLHHHHHRGLSGVLRRVRRERAGADRRDGAIRLGDDDRGHDRGDHVADPRRHRRSAGDEEIAPRAVSDHRRGRYADDGHHRRGAVA